MEIVTQLFTNDLCTKSTIVFLQQTEEAVVWGGGTQIWLGESVERASQICVDMISLVIKDVLHQGEIVKL